jgi:tRNA/tmRNA/rRNA uracil-C5-methylase (TrmA/RlmC/RlmD family)
MKDINEIEVIDPQIVTHNNNDMNNTVDLSKVSAEDLKKALAQKEKAEKQAQERAKKEYETSRDNDMLDLMQDAKFVSETLKKFKNKAHEVLERHAQKLAEYGKIRSNSKGGFSLKNTTGTSKIRRRRDTLPSWDERSEKALELIKDFLHDTIKKRDQKLFEILYSFIARNKAGDLEYAKVMNLLTHEDKYDDPRWLEGLKLIKESYSNHLKGYQYDFEVLNEDTGKYSRLDLNFSSI